MRIDFDRYTFRHFDTAANDWRTESGAWTLAVGTIASVVNTLLAVIVSYPLLKFWIMPKNK